MLSWPDALHNKISQERRFDSWLEGLNPFLCENLRLDCFKHFSWTDPCGTARLTTCNRCLMETNYSKIYRTCDIYCIWLYTLLICGNRRMRSLATPEYGSILYAQFQGAFTYLRMRSQTTDIDCKSLPNWKKISDKRFTTNYIDKTKLLTSSTLGYCNAYIDYWSVRYANCSFKYSWCSLRLNAKHC